MEDYPVEVGDDKAFIRVKGDLDTEQAGEFLRRAFNSLYEDGQRTIVLDLAETIRINSFGIGRIVGCYKRLKSDGGVLMVTSLRGPAKDLFELLMLNKIIPVEKP